MNGWVKIHRSILNWQWWPDDHMVRLWLHLIISANIEDQKWRTLVIKRGQLITTISNLSEATNISTQGIRTCLRRLEESGEINKQTTNKYTIITVCKFDIYQIEEDIDNKQSNKRIINKQQTGKKVSPTPLSKNNKNTRIYYYSSLRACTREEQKEKQFFFIFYLKGSANPSEEAENFITWNTTPDRAVAWDSCPEYARYNTARRWKVRGDRLKGYSNRASRIFTAITDALIRKNPSFLEEVYSSNKDTYPCQIEDNFIILTLPEEAIASIEENIGLISSLLRRNSIEKIIYRTPKNQKQQH